MRPEQVAFYRRRAAVKVREAEGETQLIGVLRHFENDVAARLRDKQIAHDAKIEKQECAYREYEERKAALLTDPLSPPASPSTGNPWMAILRSMREGEKRTPCVGPLEYPRIITPHVSTPAEQRAATPRVETPATIAPLVDTPQEQPAAVAPRVDTPKERRPSPPPVNTPKEMLPLTPPVGTPKEQRAATPPRVVTPSTMTPLVGTPKEKPTNTLPPNAMEQSTVVAPRVATPNVQRSVTPLISTPKETLSTTPHVKTPASITTHVDTPKEQPATVDLRVETPKEKSATVAPRVDTLIAPLVTTPKHQRTATPRVQTSLRTIPSRASTPKEQQSAAALVDTPITKLSKLRVDTPNVAKVCATLDEALPLSGPVKRVTRQPVRSKGAQSPASAVRRSMRRPSLPQSPLFLRTVHKEQQKRLLEERDRLVVEEEAKKAAPPRRGRSSMGSAEKTMGEVNQVTRGSSQIKLVDYDETMSSTMDDSVMSGEVDDLPITDSSPSFASSCRRTRSPTKTPVGRRMRSSLYETGMSDDLHVEEEVDDRRVRRGGVKRGIVSTIDVDAGTPPLANATMLHAHRETFIASGPRRTRETLAVTLDSSTGESSGGERLNVGADNSDTSMASPVRKKGRKVMLMKSVKTTRRNSSSLTPDVRRSRRIRVPRLEHYRNQTIEYESVIDEFGNHVRQIKGVTQPEVTEPDYVKYRTVNEYEVHNARARQKKAASKPKGVIAREKKAKRAEMRAAHRRGDDLSLDTDDD